MVCLGDQKRQRWRNFFKLRVKLDSVGRYRDQARGPSVQTSWSLKMEPRGLGQGTGSGGEDGSQEQVTGCFS